MKRVFDRATRDRLTSACLVILASTAAVQAGEQASAPFAGRAMILECEDDQSIAPLDASDGGAPFAASTRRDWFKVRLSFVGGADVSARGGAVDLVLHEVDQEWADANDQRATRWPVEAGAGVAVATVRFDAARREWILRATRPTPDPSLPELISEEFLRRVLGALAVRPPALNPDSPTTFVKRAGKWRKIGPTQLMAEVNQIWSRHPPASGGLVFMGWHGRMTIVDPSAPSAEKTLGSGTASESGSIDLVLGLYQDLIQSWDVRFKTGGDQYAWRH